MKKIVTMAIFIIVGIVAGILFINTSSVNPKEEDQLIRVGLVMISNKEDGSWNQTHYDALMKTQKNLNIELICKENIPEDANCKTAIEELIADGCEIIICDSFGYGEYALEAAKEHPEVFFFHATGIEQASNLATFFGRIYQMRYLSGIVAGLQTESNTIGYVAAFPIPEVNRGINAFTLGVRSVNPNAKVYVSFCNSWNLDDAARKSSEILFEKQPEIDILAMHTNSLAVCEFAEEHRIWCIGYNMDHHEQFPNSYLTAPIWSWENYYEPKLKECMQGKFIGEHVWAGIENGVVDLAPLTENVKPEIAETVENERKHLEAYDYDVFFGPIKDNAGNMRIEAGESMTDAKMLSSFDWYVEGVEIINE